jgi:calcineurin-like phosphoesterase family protein
MANIFLISDTHFGHENMYTFVRENGARVRPEFADATEGDEVMIARWNSVVRPYDKVYHLGDVCFKVDVLDRVMSRLNGKKRLVRGNHDLLQTKKYLQYFDEVYGSRRIDRLELTHIPVHEASLGKCRANVHGHTHAEPPYGPRYFNVSVERIGYTPISLEELNREIA